MSTYRSHLLEKQEVALKTVRFTFSRPEGFLFVRGQSIDIKLPTNPTDNVRTFSLLNDPEDNALSIATRITTSLYKRGLDTLNTGGEVNIEGPFGTSSTLSDESMPVVCIAGGIGVTAFYSTIKDEVMRGRNVALLYSNRSRDTALFIQELEMLEQTHAHFSLITTGTQAANGVPFKEKGRINESMLDKYFNSSHPTIYRIAGSTQFVGTMISLLKKRRAITLDTIQVEEFPGY